MNTDVYTKGLFNGSNVISPTTIKEQAYALIKDAILFRRFCIGVTYSQDAICDELNISRTPVREALLELQREGYIKILRGKGIQVIPLTKKRAKDIVEARYYLELYGSKMAAARRDNSQVTNMCSILDKQDSLRLSGDSRALYQLDRQFHQEIFKAAGNTWMQEEIENLRDHFLRVETLSAFDVPAQAEQVILEHRGILIAIRDKDESAAEEAMRYHLDCTARRTLSHILSELDD